jgi:hypothetical protein
VWFILVNFHRAGEYRVNVYFDPDEMKNSLRTGRYTHISTVRDQLGRILELAGQTKPVSIPYAQVVSSPTDPDERPGQTPPLRDMPFRAPDEVAAQDLIAIVEIVRSVMKREGEDVNLPVLSMRRERGESDIVEVELGWVAGPLYAGGRSVRVKRTSVGWEAVGGVSFWVS